MNGKPMDVKINNCSNIVLSFMGHNLKGEIDLFDKPSILYSRPPAVSDEQMLIDEYYRSIPINDRISDSSIQIGNLNFSIGNIPVIVWCFCIYTTGEETDLLFRGKKNVCELIFDNGHIRLTGDDGSRNFYAQATTYEVGQNNGNGILEIKNASVADFEYEFLGQITAWGNAYIIIEDCDIGKLKLMTKDNGRILVRNCIGDILPPLKEVGASRSSSLMAAA